MRLLTIIILVLAAQLAYGQIIDTGDGEENQPKRKGSSILDDTTKQLYGPNTAIYTHQEYIKYNKKQWMPIDTSVWNFHRYQYIAQFNNTYQNLGNVATPISPIYPVMPERIGARLGFSIYDPYFTGPEEQRIYNTRSPYSRFKIIWGGEGRAVTEADFTRNIDERSNFSFTYRGFLIDKQIERERRGDRNVLGTYYKLNGNYSTKNGRYFAYGGFTRNKQETDVYGGILLDEDSSFNAYFDENREGILDDTENNELRTNYHLYHEYRLSRQLQVYHEYDRDKQWNRLFNTSTGGEETNGDFFGPIALDTLPVSERTKLISRQHEVGVKGDMGKTFYSVYYRGREVNLTYRYLTRDSVDFRTYYMEHYAGFNMRFGNDSISYIGVGGEYFLDEHYKLNAELKNRWFYARATSSRFLPTYIQRAYLSRHNSWNNPEFESTISTKIEAGVDVAYKNLQIDASLSQNLISNYIYFRYLNDVDTTMRPIQPVQEGGDVNITVADVAVRYNFFRHFSVSGQLIFSESSSDAVRLPSWLFNGQFAYHNILYDGNLELQTGIDFHQRAAYFANGYDPSTMQYYVQDDFEVNSFPVIDIFLNIKVNRGRAFLKLNNLVEVIRGTGYFMTPHYPAQTTVLDFGIDWMLFD